MTSVQSAPFQFIPEWDDPFLSLWPHRHDYIWATHPAPGSPVEWLTERRHPLSDRLIQQGAYLYGVRFGAQTSYTMLDIDIGSPYHPHQDPLAIARMIQALEPLGLIKAVTVTSSSSNGIHLYFPFEQPHSSWQIAIVVAALLENKGFRLQPGHLEIFPNPKPYLVDSTPGLFNAHRLPLQTGSYLLNADYQPIWTTQERFVEQWRFAQLRNDLDPLELKRILKQVKRRHFNVSGKADKFINDLNAEIELGWTGSGQTNRLLGRITLRAYIFHHVLSGSAPLEGKALIEEIVETARSLPGYAEWCGHQHEIEQRATEWARCVEASHYFHYGQQLGKLTAKSEELNEAIDHAPTWNQQRSLATRDRIRSAIADLLNQGTLPAGATARFQILLTYGIGGGSLYRHRDLWHPNHLTDTANEESPSVENPPHPPNSDEDARSECGEAASNRPHLTSLFPPSDGDNPPCLAFQDRDSIESPMMDSKVEVVIQNQGDRANEDAAYRRQVQRMQKFLDSGDPILVAEAIAWAGENLDRLADLSLKD